MFCRLLLVLGWIAMIQPGFGQAKTYEEVLAADLQTLTDSRWLTGGPGYTCASLPIKDPASLGEPNQTVFFFGFGNLTQDSLTLRRLVIEVETPYDLPSNLAFSLVDTTTGARIAPEAVVLGQSPRLTLEFKNFLGGLFSIAPGVAATFRLEVDLTGVRLPISFSFRLQADEKLIEWAGNTQPRRIPTEVDTAITQPLSYGVLEGVEYTLSPCTVVLDMIDGEGDMPFEFRVGPVYAKSGGPIAQFGVRGYGVGLPTYGLLSDIATGGLPPSGVTVRVRASDKILHANLDGTPRTYRGYLPVEICHGSVNRETKWLNLRVLVTITVRPKPQS